MRSSTYESYCRTLLFGSNTVLCKSNASEMHAFRSLFTPTFRAKVQVTICGLLSKISLEQRTQKAKVRLFDVCVNPGHKHGSESLCFARLFSVSGIGNFSLK